LHPPFYIGAIWAGAFSTVDLRSTAAVHQAAGRATLSPGGRRRWAASPAQPSAVGPRTQAGGVAGRGPEFRSWAVAVSCEQCVFPFKFSISEAFCIVFLVLICCFSLS
jgi:hypothetical protein